MIYQANYEPKDHSIVISKGGEYWFSIPASVSVNDVVYAPVFASQNDQGIFFEDQTCSVTFFLKDDCIEVSCSIRYEADTPIYEAKYFKDSFGGLRISHFDRAFTTQPRRNNCHNMDFFKNLPDCSLNGYFYPTMLNFTVGNSQGWVAFGLLDLPDSYQYKLLDDGSILTESCGGNKVIPAGQTYCLPRMLITFPENDWDCISLFRNKLMEYGLYSPKKKPLSELPAWWRDPLVCTYGDELSTLYLPDARMNDPRFNADWVRMLVDTAEQKWGIKHMNIVLDAFWQLQFALDPQVDTARFGNMRDFVDEMHARGHHVIAWVTPIFDNVNNGFETVSQKMNVLSSNYMEPLGIPGSYSIDMTCDNIKEYYLHVCRVLFGDGDGEYNLDGVKMDYIGLFRDPAKTGPYRHPEKGLGIREIKIFYETFYCAAKQIKPDALINCSVTDPRFEDYIDQNRMHDTHAGNIEKEFRARLATSACPDLLIDSDGALMLTDWAKQHYICAAIYSIPSNYYTLTYHDRPLDDRDYKPMGNLLQFTVNKPDGTPVFESVGNWKLIDKNGNVNGRCINGNTVVYYPWEKNKKGYIFTWQNETVIIPLYGRKFGKLNIPVEGYQVDYARDQVIIRLKPGVVYTFESIDEENSISNLFQMKNMTSVQIEYSNG